MTIAETLSIRLKALEVAGNSSATAGLGSGHDGQPLSRPSCSRPQCKSSGSLTCSKCHLVKYCSKECQSFHWSSHKTDCKSPYMSPGWQPAWFIEKRGPAFVNGPEDKEFQTVHGQHLGRYVWGNTPAIDSLQINRNEGLNFQSDLRICFAASGDLRNLICTVNGLPENYRGRCDILVNDRDPVVVTRNLITLLALLKPGASPEESAELATHFLYSAALPTEMLSYMYECAQHLYGSKEQGWGSNRVTNDTYHVRGKGGLHGIQFVEELLDIPTKMLTSTYPLSIARKSMRSVTLAPSRVDYVDRALVCIKPAHRLSLVRFRENGVLLPFGADIERFKHPNRLLYSSDGEWLSMDDANPLYGWDMQDVLRSGKCHNVDPADLSGALFFHVKDQMQKFARRLEDFKVHIHVTQFDAQKLAESIPRGMLAPWFGNDRLFDRIETSNVMDYITPERVIRDWGPLLNRNNPHSVLLMYSMNWAIKQPGGLSTQLRDGDAIFRVMKKTADIMGLDLCKIHLQGDGSPEMMRVMYKMDACYDNQVPFNNYVRGLDLERIALKLGLRLRKTFRVQAKRLGLSLDQQTQNVHSLTPEEFYHYFVVGGADGHIRFIEFGLA